MEVAPAAGDRRREGFYRGLTDALLEFAEAHFALSKPDKSGKTRLKILIEIREQTGVVAPELAALPAVPRETEHLWRWFTDLSRRRGAGMGIEALSWPEIDSYCQLMGLHPHRWELRALTDLDDAFLASRLDNKVGVVKGAKALGGLVTGERK